MSGRYVKFGPGPWYSDDDQGVLADGVLGNGNLLPMPTVDGLGAEVSPAAASLGGLVHSDNARGLVRGGNT